MAAISTAEVKQSEGAADSALSTAGRAEETATAPSPERTSRRVGWSCSPVGMQKTLSREFSAKNTYLERDMFHQLPPPPPPPPPYYGWSTCECTNRKLHR